MKLLLLLREAGTCLKKHLITFSILVIMFGIGIISGIVLDKSVAIECYYVNYCDNYVYRIFSEFPGGIFIDRAIVSVVYIALVFPLAFSVYFVPLQGFLIFYRGFVFGSVTVILFSVYHFSGFLIWLIILLPQTLLFAAIYVTLSVLAFDCGGECRGRRDFCGMGGFVVYAVVALIASLLCALLEFLVIFLIFRPVSKIL